MTADEIKKLAEKGEKAPADADQSADISNLKSSLDKEKADKEAAQKELAETKFSAAFDRLSSLYPHAAEFKDEIRKKVESGYDVDDAVVSTLKKNDKLVTADDVRRQENKGAGLGGSAKTGDLDADKGKGQKTIAELEQEFKDAEARGEIVLS